MQSLLAGVPLSVPGLSLANAPQFPQRPVTLVVPFAPGGTSDFLATPMVQRLSAILGQQVVIKNVAGAGGVTGAAEVAAAAPDGYTLLMSSSSHFVSEGMRTDLPYQYLKSFKPVAVMASVPAVLVVRTASPLQSLKDVLGRIEGDGRAMFYGTAGVGSVQHAASEFFNRRAQSKVQPKHFNSGGQMQTALQAGEVDYCLDTLPSAMVHLRAGRIRALGVTSAKRVFALPEVASLSQLGLPGFDLPVWYGVVAPSGTPAEVINLLNTAINAALNTGEVKAQLLKLGTQPITASAIEWDGISRLELQRWKRLVVQTQMCA
jgi:tripartite-type tricarboxylate transporter receptor subunit TctC